MIIVSFPRSGRTWLSHMLADALEIPLANKLPASEVDELLSALRPERHVEYVLARHDEDPHELISSGTKIVYLLRDPRDVVISYYYYKYHWKRARRHLLRRWWDFLREDILYGGPPTLGDDMGETLPEWRSHVLRWRPFFGHVPVVKYESLHDDPQRTLEKLADGLAFEIPEEKLRESVERHRFETEVGRPPGEEDPEAFRRKGIVGDWRTQLGEEEREMVKETVGDLLIDLGYEESGAW